MNYSKLFKKIGLSLLIVPVAFLTFFGVGELLGGVSGALLHFVQLLPLVILFVIALFNSEWAGYLLIVIGAILGFLYLISSGFPPATVLLVELMLFVMPVVSGVLLIMSVRINK